MIDNISIIAELKEIGKGTFVAVWCPVPWIRNCSCSLRVFQIKSPISKSAIVHLNFWMNLLFRGMLASRCLCPASFRTMDLWPRKAKVKKIASEWKRPDPCPVCTPRRIIARDTTDEMKWKKTGPANRLWNGWRERKWEDIPGVVEKSRQSSSRTQAWGWDARPTVSCPEYSLKVLYVRIRRALCFTTVVVGTEYSYSLLRNDNTQIPPILKAWLW